MSKRRKHAGGDMGSSSYSLASTHNNCGTPKWHESRARFRMEGEPAEIKFESASKFPYDHSLSRNSLRIAWLDFAAALEGNVKPEIVAHARMQAQMRTPLRERAPHPIWCRCPGCNEITDTLASILDASE